MAVIRDTGVKVPEGAVSWSSVKSEDLHDAFVALCEGAEGGVYHVSPSERRMCIRSRLPEPGYFSLVPKRFSVARIGRDFVDVRVVGKYRQESYDDKPYGPSECVTLGRELSAWQELYDSSSVRFKRSLAFALNRSRGVEHPVMGFINGLEDGEQRFRAMRTVLLNCGENELVDDFTDVAMTGELSWQGEYDLFLSYVKDGFVDLDRAHLVNDRYCAFETVHEVYPYVPGPKRAYEIPGTCVSDMLQGRMVTGVARGGLGDDETTVYAAGDLGAAARRVVMLHDSFMDLLASEGVPVEKREKECLYYVRATEEAVFSLRSRMPDGRFEGGLSKAVSEASPKLRQFAARHSAAYAAAAEAAVRESLSHPMDLHLSGHEPVVNKKKSHLKV
jgi:hypothetical protein